MRVRTEVRRQAILAVAGPLFLRDGYGALSMATIAAAVGGSKGTLYSYFRSKEELFAAFITEIGVQQFDAFLGASAAGGDLRSALSGLGRGYLRLVLAPEIMAVYRLVIAEIERFPEIGEIFFDIGPRRTLERVSATLCILGQTHGLPALATADAAAHFKGLCEARLFDRALWGIGGPVGPNEIEAAVESAVERFLLGYGSGARRHPAAVPTSDAFRLNSGPEQPRRIPKKHSGGHP